MSRNYLTSLVFAVAFLVAANVRADMQTFVYGISTADTADWNFASLFTSGDTGYTNPTASGKKYTSVGTTWSSISNKYIGKWDDLAWSEASQGTRYTWKDSGKDWVAPTGANEQYGNAHNWASNGFYAYKYSLEALGSESAVDVSLRLDLMADDYIAAIYANGKEIYSSTPITVGGKPSDMGWLTGWSDSLTVDLMNGVLDLVFVIHNTNLGGSNTNNASGLYVKGTLTTNVEMVPPGETPLPPPPTTATPEPATLAVLGLGLAGLGMVRARRRK